MFAPSSIHQFIPAHGCHTQDEYKAYSSTIPFPFLFTTTGFWLSLTSVVCWILVPVVVDREKEQASWYKENYLKTYLLTSELHQTTLPVTLMNPDPNNWNIANVSEANLKMKGASKKKTKASAAATAAAAGSEATYKDYMSLEDDDQELADLLSKTDAEGVKGTDQTFPVKLHQLLSSSDEDGFSHIGKLCWMLNFGGRILFYFVIYLLVISRKESVQNFPGPSSFTSREQHKAVLSGSDLKSVLFLLPSFWSELRLTLPYFSRSSTPTPATVSWQPHGRSFIVKKHKEFVEKVLP